MKTATEGGSDFEVEELSIGFDHNKQNTSDSKKGFEADTAAGEDSQTHLFEEDFQ